MREFGRFLISIDGLILDMFDRTNRRKISGEAIRKNLRARRKSPETQKIAIIHQGE